MKALRPEAVCWAGASAVVGKMKSSRMPLEALSDAVLKLRFGLLLIQNKTFITREGGLAGVEKQLESRKPTSKTSIRNCENTKMFAHYGFDRS